MSTDDNSRRSFLIESIAGLNAVWVAANFPSILAAQDDIASRFDLTESFADGTENTLGSVAPKLPVVIP